jgi:hypothetical protein
MKHPYSFRWGGAALAGLLALAASAAAGDGPVTFNSPVAPGEKVELSGSVVTLGPEVVLGAGSELVVRASEAVVFSPGVDLSAGRFDSRVGDAALDKRIASASSFVARIRPQGGSYFLRYDLPKAGTLRIRLSDLRGKTAFSRVLHSRSAGRHEEAFGFTPRESGMYFLRAEFGNSVAVQRIYFGKR